MGVRNSQKFGPRVPGSTTNQLHARFYWYTYIYIYTFDGSFDPIFYIHSNRERATDYSIYQNDANFPNLIWEKEKKNV